jgi:PAS domain S-box-containing protein
MDKDDTKELYKGINELKKEIKFYKSIVDNTYDWEYLVDNNGNMLYVSPSCERITGFSPKLFIEDNKLLEKIVLKEDWPELSKHFKEEINSNVSYSFDFRIVSKDGKEKWIEHKCQPVYDEKRNLVGRRASNRDITEGKYRSLYLLMNEGMALHQIIFDNENNPIDYIILDVNPSFEKITGLEREKIIGKKATEIYGVDKAPYMDVYYKVANTRIPTKFEIDYGPMQKSFSISVFAPEKNKFVTVFEDITDIKKSEELLKESEEEFRSYVENAPYGIFIADRNGNFVEANTEACKMAGYSREELLKLKISDMVESDQVKYSREHFGEVLKTGKASRLSPYLIKSREKRYWTVDAVKLSEDRILGFVKDVTERILAEELLKESEHRFRELYDNMATGVAIYKAIDNGNDFIFKDMNKAGQRLSKVDIKEIKGKRILDEFPGAVKIGLFGAIKKVYRTGESVYLPTTLYQDDRIIQWVDNYVYKLSSEEIVAIYSDVSKQKKAEQEIFKLSKFPSENPNPILRVSKDGTLLYANNSSAELISYWKISAGNILPIEIIQLINQATSSKKQISIDVVVNDKIFSLTITPIPAENYFNIYGKDVTEERKNQEEIIKYQSHLEDLVAERTARLEIINKELEAFSYSVSHDLRAPLRAIDGFAQALSEDYSDKLGEEGQHYLRRIRNATIKMGNLIDDMLKLSRISRTIIKKERVNLSDLVEEIVKEFKKSNPSRKVIFSIQKDAIVNGDFNLLKIMLENLLSNAWKFTSKKDEVKIEFGIIKKETKNIYYIKDNGVGFDMEYKDKLFAPFHRLHSEDEFPGTGVGLANVKRIITMHEGEIWAEGKVGRGAVFYFTL